MNSKAQQHNTTCNTQCYTASFVLSLCYVSMCYRGCNSVCYTCGFLEVKKYVSGFIRYETCFIFTALLRVVVILDCSAWYTKCRLQSLHNIQALGKRIQHTV